MFRSDKRAEVSIASLILMIAIILIVAVVVVILLQLSNTAQNKAMVTAQDKTKDIGFGFQSIEIYGKDASDDGADGDLTYLYWMIKVTAGSETGDHNNSIVKLSLKNQTASYSYLYGSNYTYQNVTYTGSCSASNVSTNVSVNGTYSISCANFNSTIYTTVNRSIYWNSTGGYCASNATTGVSSVSVATTQFAKTSTKATTTATAQENSYKEGDIFQVCIISPRDIVSDEKVKFIFMPQKGDLLRANVVTPARMSDVRVVLFP